MISFQWLTITVCNSSKGKIHSQEYAYEEIRGKIIILMNVSSRCKRQIAMVTRGLLVWHLLTELQPVQ